MMKKLKCNNLSDILDICRDATVPLQEPREDRPVDEEQSDRLMITPTAPARELQEFSAFAGRDG